MKIDSANVRTIVNDSPLGRWTHHEYRAPDLAGAVDVIWHFEGLTALPRERSFAKTHTEIILQLGPRFREVHANGGRGALFPIACVGGATTMPSVMAAPANTCCVIGMHVSPRVAALLLCVSPREILNCTVDLADATSNDAISLVERCYGEQSIAGGFALVHQWIRARLCSTPESDNGIRWAVTQLEISNGTRPVADLQNAFGLSRARFRMRFREHVGIAPKQFARIVRFQNALKFLRDGHSLSASAHTSGYYDQAHMHRDFSEFAMLTPATFASATRFPNSASLPESAPK